MEDASRPVAGVDYPCTFEDFDRWFADETLCRNYLYRVRWPNGYRCPKCESDGPPWVTSRGYLHCRDCEGEISVTSGTIFERTRTPLRLWFLAMWFVTSQKDGASALGLQRVLGLGSYQTAWTWLHKLRRAMVRPGRTRLHGCVEVDETYVGGTEKDGKRGRGTENKEIVVIAIEVHNPKGFGRVRMKRIPDAAGKSLVPFVCDVVEKGSTVITDGWAGYDNLEKNGYVHDVKYLSDTGDPAHVVLPGPHRIAGLLKRWLLSTHQGSVMGDHLDYYLDEYTFRFNRRTSRSRGLLFYRLMEQAVAVPPTPYRDIVGGRRNI